MTDFKYMVDIQTWWCAWSSTRAWWAHLLNTLLGSNTRFHKDVQAIIIEVNDSINEAGGGLSVADLHRLLWWERKSCQIEPDSELPLLGKKLRSWQTQTERGSWCQLMCDAWFFSVVRVYANLWRDGAPAAAPAERSHQPSTANIQMPLEELRHLLHHPQRLQTGTAALCHSECHLHTKTIKTAKGNCFPLAFCVWYLKLPSNMHLSKIIQPAASETRKHCEKEWWVGYNLFSWWVANFSSRFSLH